MTMLEFCEGYFPDERLFYEAGEGRLAVRLQRLFKLEDDEYRADIWVHLRVRPSDILFTLAPRMAMRSCPGREWPEEVILTEEDSRRMKDFRLVIDPEVTGMDFDVRRPYFRMRGRPVTEEQAFDIIRRTDNFFRFDMDQYHLDDLVGNRRVLDNVLYSPNFYPHPRGWVRPDGTIGTNDITGKYPNELEFVDSVLPLMCEFPYLDMMIGVTDWNEGPDYAWEAPEYSDALRREDYPDFEEHIVYGIWLHDGALELMAPARAREKYAEYRRLYAGPDEDIFRMNYCEDNHVHPADLEYLKRCIRSHGLDPEEALARYEWDPVEGLRYVSAPKEKEEETGWSGLCTL